MDARKVRTAAGEQALQQHHDHLFWPAVIMNARERAKERAEAARDKKSKAHIEGNFRAEKRKAAETEERVAAEKQARAEAAITAATHIETRQQDHDARLKLYSIGKVYAAAAEAAEHAAVKIAKHSDSIPDLSLELERADSDEMCDASELLTLSLVFESKLTKTLKTFAKLCRSLLRRGKCLSGAMPELRALGDLLNSAANEIEQVFSAWSKACRTVITQEPNDMFLKAMQLRFCQLKVLIKYGTEQIRAFSNQMTPLAIEEANAANSAVSTHQINLNTEIQTISNAANEINDFCKIVSGIIGDIVSDYLDVEAEGRLH